MNMKQVYLPLIILFSPVLFFFTARLVKALFHFPMPPIMADLIDNPLRRRIQPPEQMPSRHGIHEGMRVLEVGPGNGRYGVETARQVGSGGMLVAVDIQFDMLAKTRLKAKDEGIANLHTALVDVHNLPFKNGSFNAIYMIAVIGEIPQPVEAINEFHRVLQPGGTLAFSELLPDPDFPLPKTLIRHAEGAGFHIKNRMGSWLTYTLVFEKKENISTS